jgi:hypothetical protein
MAYVLRMRLVWSDGAALAKTSLNARYGGDRSGPLRTAVMRQKAIDIRPAFGVLIGGGQALSLRGCGRSLRAGRNCTTAICACWAGQITSERARIGFGTCKRSSLGKIPSDQLLSQLIIALKKIANHAFQLCTTAKERLLPHQKQQEGGADRRLAI